MAVLNQQLTVAVFFYKATADARQKADDDGSDTLARLKTQLAETDWLQWLIPEHWRLALRAAGTHCLQPATLPPAPVFRLNHRRAYSFASPPHLAARRPAGRRTCSCRCNSSALHSRGRQLLPEGGQAGGAVRHTTPQRLHRPAGRPRPPTTQQTVDQTNEWTILYTTQSVPTNQGDPAREAIRTRQRRCQLSRKSSHYVIDGNRNTPRLNERSLVASTYC